VWAPPGRHLEWRLHADVAAFCMLARCVAHAGAVMMRRVLLSPVTDSGGYALHR
jgi:hypothetical protein